MSQRFRPRAADLISFTTLASSMGAMGLAIGGSLQLAAGLILLGYVLDGLDGAVARRLGGFSEVGTQLDSLIDVVHFGAANSILISGHLAGRPFGGWPVWLALTGYMIAACYRLARFNLTDGHLDKRQTVGLTISTGGATLAIAVLADLALGRQLIPGWGFLLLIGLTALLMISRVPFPDLRGLPALRAPVAATIGAGLLLALLVRFEVGLLFVWSVYLLFGTLRAGVRLLARLRSHPEGRPESLDQRSTA